MEDSLPGAAGQSDNNAIDKAERPRRRNRTLALVLTAGVVIGAALAAAGYFGYRAYDNRRDQPKPLLVVGTMTLIGSASWDAAAAGGCEGSGGYSDIRQGTRVVLTNESGTTIGVSSLEKGSKDGSDCMFLWTMLDVPATEKFYTLEIARRGELTYTRKDLELPLTTTLGGK
ncbi:hypothetical protein [Nocardia brasiliensis]|uniref:hypothetical protein n=1 Tax=Nocardia brasiliensis TaxID=37326 RepID=UPI00068C619D|nr:hypothetical protein [Nocardia brasiliensis]